MPPRRRGVGQGTVTVADRSRGATITHPAGLRALFLTELWERFAYYGMRGLLVLYLIDTTTGGLGWSQERASRLYGWFIGLVYLSPVLGGWLGDRYLGTARSLVAGGLLLSAGYFVLSLSHGGAAFYLGLALIVLGGGFFKPNGYTMVGQLYRPADPRRDSGFTVYYMAINVGALLGPLACAWLAAAPGYGWSYGFAAAGVAMTLGLGFYLWARRTLLRGVGLPPPRRRDTPAPARPGPLQLSRDELDRVIAVAIITVFVVFFWLAFEQAGSSLNVFAAQRTDRVIEGWLGGALPGGEIPAAWFLAINPLFILLLAPLMAALWRRLGPRAPSTPAKMALGLTLLGLAYLFVVAGAARSDAGTRVTPWFLIAFYFVYSCGELCFLPVGISFVSQAAPARLASRLMGAWLTANFAANLIGGYVAGMVQRIERGEVFRILGGQADFFLIFVVSCLLAGGLLGLLVPTLRRLMGDRMQPRAEFASVHAAPPPRSRR
ncbi:MAG TPA: peptide MFS transporter [Gemmatimonadales bacterium]|nr:peptide MFS transporter [Gemmatimonadales bacterium]